MKILVPIAHSGPDHGTVGYVINIAERLNAQLVVLRILTEEETEATGEKSLRLFVENGKKEKVPVNAIIRRGEIVTEQLSKPSIENLRKGHQRCVAPIIS